MKICVMKLCLVLSIAAGALAAAHTGARCPDVGRFNIGDQPRRVVAIGDLHGDFDKAVRVLRMAGVLDSSGDGEPKWVGGDTVVVQVGDVVDRGPDSGRILGLLEELGRDASRSKGGGAVIPLLGNHELMNLDGDLRYVSPADEAWFGDSTARARAFLPSGRFGAMLRCRPVVARVGSDIFVHAGILPTHARHGVDGINRRAREALWEGRSEPILHGRDSVVWTRRLSLDDDPRVCADLDAALQRLGGERMIVGHTIQEHGAVATRCGGRLILIDVGMSSAYDGGSPATALEIVAAGPGGASSSSNRTETFVLRDIGERAAVPGGWQLPRQALKAFVGAFPAADAIVDRICAFLPCPAEAQASDYGEGSAAAGSGAPLSTWTKRQLRDELRTRGLPVHGVKSELRLRVAADRSVNRSGRPPQAPHVGNAGEPFSRTELVVGPGNGIRETW